MPINLATITKYVNKARPGHLQERDVSYGAKPSMKLDVYGVPGEELKPVVLFWHGGSWKSGHKSYYEFMADYLQHMGIIPIIVGYPLYPEQTFPGFIDDAQAAVQWARVHVAEYGGDPDRLFVMGHSAGGHTAVMLTLQDTQNYIAGCISFAAPMTLARRYWENVFGKDAFDKGHQNPVNHISAQNRHRFLLIHGKTDRIVMFRDSRKLYRRLKKAGYPVEFVTLQFMGHFRILTTMIRPVAYRYKVGKRVKAFVYADTHL